MWPEGEESLATAAIAAGGIAAASTALAMPWAHAAAIRWRVLDRPDGRKAHLAPIPRLGGLAVIAGVAVALAALSPVVPIDPGPSLWLAISAVGLVFAVGLVDDVRGLPFWAKLPVELLAASLVVAIGWGFGELRVPGLGLLTLGWAGLAVSVVWIVGVTNAINWVDGVDGLAGGVVAIVASSLFVHALLDGNADTVTVVSAAAIAGASAEFLRFNWPPARLFLGDCGSLTLGFLLAALTARAATKPAALAVLVPLAALGVPLTDALLVVGRRFRETPAGPLGARLLRTCRGDRNHLHHLLESSGLTARAVVGTIYGLVLASCLFGVLVSINQRPALALPLLAVQFGVVACVRRLAVVRWSARSAPTLEATSGAEAGDGGIG